MYEYVMAPEQDVVISSRVRLSRNYEDLPFSPKLTRECAEEVIERCVSIKRDLVELDERDEGPRKLLNLGHTVGHAVELLSGYTVTHGSAVAIGMAIIARMVSAAPNLLIAFQPTRGLDVGAIEFVHKALIRERDLG